MSMFKINEVYNEDCLVTLQKMGSNLIDLVITSPPYNCGINYDVYKDDLPWDDYMDWCKIWLTSLYDKMKSGGRICVNILLEMGIENNKRRVSPYAEFYRLYQEVGFKPFGSPVWVDSHRVKYTAWGSWLKSTSPYIYCPYELVLIGYKDKWKREGIETKITKEEFMMGCSGIWSLRTQTREITKANFHIDLPTMCIKLLSGEGDLVYDPFIGSGTTAIAAINEGRNYIGSEISPTYCKIAKERISLLSENERKTGGK